MSTLVDDIPREGSVIGPAPWVTRRVLPEPFTWGHVRTTHVVGPYAIVEYDERKAANEGRSWKPCVLFHPFIYGHGRDEYTPYDTHNSYDSLDRALLAAITQRAYLARGDHNGASNERASGLMAKMIAPWGCKDEPE